MNERISVTLDFTKCRFISELFEEMRTQMRWPDFFGDNLDALWDILTGMPYIGDDFTILRPIRYANIPHGQNDRFTEYVDRICKIFQRAQQQYGDITVSIRYSDIDNEELLPYLI